MHSSLELGMFFLEESTSSSLGDKYLRKPIISGLK